MTAWSILCGAAATFIGAAGTHAVELPVNKAASATQHARLCTINGAPGYIVPGSDTCLKISGDVRFETIIVGGSKRLDRASIKSLTAN